MKKGEGGAFCFSHPSAGGNRKIKKIARQARKPSFFGESDVSEAFLFFRRKSERIFRRNFDSYTRSFWNRKSEESPSLNFYSPFGYTGRTEARILINFREVSCPGEIRSGGCNRQTEGPFFENWALPLSPTTLHSNLPLWNREPFTRRPPPTSVGLV